MELFQLIKNWARPEVFEAECEGYSGFSKIIGSHDGMKLPDYVQIAESINKRFVQILVLCFENPKMYMKTRAGLIVLNRMSPVFPSTI